MDVFDMYFKGVKHALVFDINRIIFNGPATIVFFENGEKVIVRRKKGERDDRHAAIMYAILKRQFGSSHAMNKYLSDLIENAKVEDSKKNKKKNKK